MEKTYFRRKLLRKFLQIFFSSYFETCLSSHKESVYRKSEIWLDQTNIYQCVLPVVRVILWKDEMYSQIATSSAVGNLGHLSIHKQFLNSLVSLEFTVINLNIIEFIQKS